MPNQLRLRNAFNHFICFHPQSSWDPAPSHRLLGGTFAAAVKCFIYPALMTPLRIGLSESDTHIQYTICPSLAVAFASYEAVVCSPGPRGDRAGDGDGVGGVIATKHRQMLRQPLQLAMSSVQWWIVSLIP